MDKIMLRRTYLQKNKVKRRCYKVIEAVGRGGESHYVGSYIAPGMLKDLKAIWKFINVSYKILY